MHIGSAQFGRSYANRRGVAKSTHSIAVYRTTGFAGGVVMYYYNDDITLLLGDNTQIPASFPIKNSAIMEQHKSKDENSCQARLSDGAPAQHVPIEHPPDDRKLTRLFHTSRP